MPVIVPAVCVRFPAAAIGQLLVTFTFMGVVLPMVIIPAEVDVAVVSIVIVVAVMLAVAGPQARWYMSHWAQKSSCQTHIQSGTVHT